VRLDRGALLDQRLHRAPHGLGAADLGVAGRLGGICMAQEGAVCMFVTRRVDAASRAKL
jgi:hypothetical protein